MPSIKSLIVVVGRYSASGFCFAQVMQNRSEAKAKNHVNHRTDFVIRDWQTNRVRFIGPLKHARPYPPAH